MKILKDPMPSGHGQSVGFSTAFLFLGQSSSYLLIIALFISCLTFIQRYKYRRHTIVELCIGFIIGICFASPNLSVPTGVLTNITSLPLSAEEKEKQKHPIEEPKIDVCQYSLNILRKKNIWKKTC